MIHFGQIKFGSNHFRNKIFLFLLIIVLIIAAFNFFQTWRKNHEINNEINELHNQLSRLEKNNLELNELIA
jgi:cell division protein FtsL